MTAARLQYFEERWTALQATGIRLQHVRDFTGQGFERLSHPAFNGWGHKIVFGVIDRHLCFPAGIRYPVRKSHISFCLWWTGKGGTDG